MSTPITWSGWIVPNGGINETVSPQQIDDNAWTEAQNVEPVPDGVRSRRGYIKVNATALGATSTAGTSTIAITGIFDYRLSDAATTRHLIVAGTAAYKQVSGTMTSIGTGFTANENVYPSFANARDVAWIANGTDAPRKLYISSGTDIWSKQGITAPTATATASAVAGGSLATGVWYVDYYFWNNDLGYPSNTKYAGATTVAATLSAGTQSIVVTGLPTAAATDEKVTHVRISLRSPAGTVFRFAGTAEAQITLGTSSATITADATGDEVEYDYDVPPVHSITETGAGYRFVAGINGYPARIMWNKVSGNNAYYEAYPAANFRDFGKGDGNYTTALAFIPPQTLVVGFKDQIYAIDARRPGTSDAYLLGRGVGIAHHRAWIVVGRRLYFISNADRSKGPHVWDGSAIRPVQGIDDTFKGLNQTRLRYAVSAHYAPGDNRWQWWTLVTSASGTQHDRILVYDYALESWSVYTVPTGEGNVIGEVETSGSVLVYQGGRDGREYQRDSGATDDSDSIIAYVRGKAFDFGLPDAIKRLRWIRYVAQEQSSGGLTLQVESDYGDSQNFSANLGYTSDGSAFTLGTSVLGGTAVLAGGGDTSRRVALRGTGRVFRPRFSTTSAFHLKGLAFGVQPTNRRS